jgi:protein phosphatase 1G
MGSAASYPDTSKTFYDLETIFLRIGVCEMKGWRITMEDSSLAVTNIDKKNSSLFGIMDGHNGSIVSKFISNNLKNILVNSEYYKKENYEKALIESFLKIDEYLKNKNIKKFLLETEKKNKLKNFQGNPLLDYNNKLNENYDENNNISQLYYDGKYLKLNTSTLSSSKDYSDNDSNYSEKSEKINNNNNNFNFVDECGSTANIILINNKFIYIANVGDSLSLMYKNGKIYKLSNEHKTTSKSEIIRIKKFNKIKLINNRIDGKINITRAIGDFNYKKNVKLNPYDQIITSYPEVKKIQISEDIDFIIMASDGVWDCVDQQKLCESIEKELKENKNNKLSNIIGNIFDNIISKNNFSSIGTDNMSCIIIQFKNKKLCEIQEEEDDEN